MSRSVTLQARAKINLALHVVGQRADGYHLLDSLVAFADFGDEIRIARGRGRADGEHRLTIAGPFARGLETDGNNLVLKAVRLMGERLPALDIHLEKRLPVASGIGGGSADAAAALRAVSQLLDLPMPSAGAILSLGADVPVCVAGTALRMRGIGEDIGPVPPLPALAAVLANPGLSVATPSIFKALAHKTNPPLAAFPGDGFADAAALCGWLRETRNDLEPVAVEIGPAIRTCLDALAASKDALLHRMSGSGATCFGLYATVEAARQAAESLKAAHPGWWVIATSIL